MKILLADDSITIRRIVSNELNQLGYTDIVQVDCGDDAIAALAEHPDIKLVLLDWNMPMTNGFECLKIIKNNEATKTIPVIMVTAEALRSRIMEAIKAGAHGYLVKPFSKEKLREVIANSLNPMTNVQSAMNNGNLLDE